MRLNSTNLKKLYGKFEACACTSQTQNISSWNCLNVCIYLSFQIPCRSTRHDYANMKQTPYMAL